MLGHPFFQRDPRTCARELLGCKLVWRGCGGIVVETEAYSVLGDDACHTFARPSARTFVERHAAGAAYIYLNYGVHWLLNVLVKGGCEDGFVLIRALEPTLGIGRMQTRRGTRVLAELCSGPGKLSRALGVRGVDHGRDFCADREIGFIAAASPVETLTGARIGISKAAHLPWRFLLAGSSFVSVKLSGHKKARPVKRPGL